MSELQKGLPIIALRGMTILPYMVIHFDVSRKKSINSVDYAIKNGQKIFLVSQIDPNVIDPKMEDIYSVGTLCEIKQVVKMPGGFVRVLVKGIHKAMLAELYDKEEMLMGDIQVIKSHEIMYPESEIQARIKFLRTLLMDLYTVNDREVAENKQRLKKITSLEEMVYRAISDCTTDYEKRQEALEIEDLFERCDYACDLITQEIEVAGIKKELAEDVKNRVEQHQKEYVLREQLHVIREELGDGDVESEADEYRAQVEKLDAPQAVCDKLLKEIKRFEGLSPNSSESGVIRTYVETLLELPWNKVAKDNMDIKKVQKVLSEDHYGLLKVKERILEFMAVRALNEKGESPVICLVGPPGTGKTSIASSIARALNRKYVRVCLGGVRDEAEIRGHRKTYVGAMPGRIVEGLKQAGVSNPLMLLDEIDKVGTDSRGDTASALLEILDGAQNVAFRDHYVEVPVDLSRVLFVATANDVSTIPKPLLDRMEIIEINSYTQVEKFHIAKKHLIPKQLAKNGMTKKQVSVSDEAIRKIISGYTKEAGVRNLERKIGKLCRKAAVGILMEEKPVHKVTPKNLVDYLGVAKYDADEKNSKDQVGLVKGLAWTAVGGTTLDVEVITMPGKGNLILTGQLGDVMKESASVALGYVRTKAAEYDIAPEFFEKNDIQIHVPEGAVPKDGPSAGITITLALISAITGRKVACDVAMTGEITLRGNVLPIGGLKEKILAAKLAGINTVLIPKKNENDLKEIEEEILEGMQIIPVSVMDDVIKAALRK